MSIQDYNKAKEIFIKYGGSHCYMEREGEYGLYRIYKISKEQESLWIKEYQQELIDKIKVEVDFIDLLIEISRTICQYKNLDSLSNTLETIDLKIQQVDSFTKMRIAEEILEVVECLMVSKIKNCIVKDARLKSIELLKNILKGPITVAEHYQKIDYLGDEIKEENIIMRIEKKLKIWERE